MRSLVVALALVACRGGDAPRAPLHVKPDPHSFAQPEVVRVEHLSLALNVDFATHLLAGTAKLTVTGPGKTLVLDTDHLTIERVDDCAGKPLPFAVAAAVPVRGSALTIERGAAACVAVTYQTARDARALLWVDPAGTAGKQQPMLFTQSEPILARSWIPLQDTPGVRFTYDATITVPHGLWALMSAKNPQQVAPDGVYRFVMRHPIPSYLMALAVGDFAFRPIGKRTGVYAEPSVVGAAAYEFAEVDQMMAAAEKLYGAYQWDRYDMLVLPPSFPFGGMENPELTFLTPTAIAGDRSLVSLIAHELAHSWSGNLVTNSTWSDTWLNEGVTTYVERRIIEQLHGKDEADIDWALSYTDLQKALADFKPDDPHTFLALHLRADEDPDDTPGAVSYEKGSLFMRALELAFGREVFDSFMRRRFRRLAFTSSDTETFEADANAELWGRAKSPPAWGIASWLHAGGIPATTPQPRSTAVDRIQGMAAALEVPPPGWTTAEWVIYLRAVPATATPAQLDALDAAHHLSTGNAEILMHWLPLLVRADMDRAAPLVRAYLTTVGRIRMVARVYRALVAAGPTWQALAREIYAQAEPLYHPLTREAITSLLRRAPSP